MEEKEWELSGEAFQNVKDYVEEVKEFLSGDVWGSIFLDCTKNEVLIFWLLYQKTEVNMTEIADYIHVPLNTATGIINRMEKNGMVVRTRSKEDKRVVLIQFSEKGMAQFQSLFHQITYYGMKVLGTLTSEELELFRKMTGKVLDVLKQEKKKEETTPKIRKITIE